MHKDVCGVVDVETLSVVSVIAGFADSCFTDGFHDFRALSIIVRAYAATESLSFFVFAGALIGRNPSAGSYIIP